MVKDLTRGSPTRLLLSFAFATLLSAITSYVYAITDSLMLSYYVHPDALGAISAAAPPSDAIEVLFFGIVSGFPIVAGHIFGAGDEKGLRNVMANSVYLSIILIGIATAVSAIFCRPMILMMNTPASFVDMAETYFFIRAFGNAISGVMRLCTDMFCALGNSKTGVYASLLCGFSNVGFNFLFLGVFGMGIEGAAYGTVCAQALGAIFCIIVLCTRMRILLFGRKDAAFSLPTVKKLLRNGVPLGLQSTLIVLGSMMLQYAINGHGELAVTGISIGNRLLNFLWMLFQAFETALLYFCAQNLGAGEFSRIRRGVRNALLINLGIGALCMVLLFFFSEPILSLFAGGEQEIITAAKTYFFSQMVFFPVMVALCIWRGGLKGMGSAMPAMVGCMIELLTRAVISTFFSDNLTVLYMAGPLAWSCTTVFFAVLYPITLKRMERAYIPPKEKEQPPIEADEKLQVQ